MIGLIATVTKCDVAAFQWCMARKRAAMIASISRRISSIGDGYFYLLLGVLLWFLESKVGAEFFYSALLAFSIELPLYLVFKNLIKRNRPQDALQGFEAFLVPSDKFSFPSGHTAAAFLVACVVSHFYPEFTVFAYGLAAMIGSSRVLLGVHFPSDILAGAALGLGSAVLALSMMGY